MRDLLAGGDGDLVGAVELGDEHVDALGVVGREVLADVVGRSGSSRWPRSASTASWTRAGRP